MRSCYHGLLLGVFWSGVAKMTKTGPNRVKVNISLTPELLETLDNYCEAIGVTRSAFVQTTLGQTLYNLGLVQQTVADVLGDAVKQAAADES